MWQQVGVIYGNPEITSGGNALKFYSSVRLEVRRKETIKGSNGEDVGIRVKAKVPPLHIAACLQCFLSKLCHFKRSTSL